MEQKDQISQTSVGEIPKVGSESIKTADLKSTKITAGVQEVHSQEIFSEFREHSVAEFFKKNRQMLGFSGKVRSLTTLVHEYVTNSLDACEEAKILPNIYVKIDNLPNGHIRLYVEDNGPGIPKQFIGRALGQMLAGTKFHRFVQQRGQQGIGATGGTMYAQITTGKPIHCRSSTGDNIIYECDVAVDLKTNSPKISNMVEYTGKYRGLTIIGEFGEVKYDKSEYSAFEYLKATALANPHAQITIVDPEGERTVFQRAHEEVPERPKPAQPHPLGVTTDDLINYAHHSKERKLSSFLTSNFARVSDSKVEELKKLCPSINFDKMPRELKWEEAEAIVRAFKQIKWIAPSADPLRPIGKEQIEKALKNVLQPEFVSVSERSPKVFRGGVPFLVEVGIAYKGKAGRQKSDGTVGLDVKRFANRAPLLFDAGGCATMEAVKTIDWGRYGLKDIENMPVTLFMNLVSVHVPYTSAGKQAISNEEEIVEEFRYAIMEVARDLDRYLSGKIRDEQREARKKAIMRYVKQISSDLPYLAGEKTSEELEKKLLHIIESKYSKMFDKGRLTADEEKQIKKEIEEDIEE
ncbi:MAG: DNA topoisomerase VI subunit B [Candidatus Micrarchaeota archaeon]|nr:DNA topoisomerase VI subunit B [Candidatus Micrarchaeota archaeon]